MPSETQLHNQRRRRKDNLESLGAEDIDRLSLLECKEIYRNGWEEDGRLSCGVSEVQRRVTALLWVERPVVGSNNINDPQSAVRTYG